MYLEGSDSNGPVIMQITANRGGGGVTSWVFIHFAKVCNTNIPYLVYLMWQIKKMITVFIFKIMRGSEIHSNETHSAGSCRQLLLMMIYFLFRGVCKLACIIVMVDFVVHLHPPGLHPQTCRKRQCASIST